MSGRDAVLAGIRRSLGRGELDQQNKQQLRERLQEPPDHVRIDWDEDSVERFVAKSEAQAATVARVASLADVGDAVAEFLKAHNLPAIIAAAPALEDLDWPEQLTVDFGVTRGEHEVSVTPCHAAIAETGSVALLSGDGSPTSLNLLPDNHVVVLRTSQITRNFEDVWESVQTDLPRAVNFITGPSRTADVEQTMQLGAHGPRRVHIVLVDD